MPMYPSPKAEAAGYSGHLIATKSWLIDIVRRFGAKVALGDKWEGTDEEAVAAIQNDPREVIPSADCDNVDERGYCLGHPLEDR